MKKHGILEFIIVEIVYLTCASIFAYKAVVVFLHYSEVHLAWLQATGYTLGTLLIAGFAVGNLVIYIRRHRRGPADEPQPQPHENENVS